MKTIRKFFNWIATSVKKIKFFQSRIEFARSIEAIDRLSESSIKGSRSANEIANLFRSMINRSKPHGRRCSNNKSKVYKHRKGSRNV